MHIHFQMIKDRSTIFSRENDLRHQDQSIVRVRSSDTSSEREKLRSRVAMTLRSFRQPKIYMYAIFEASKTRLLYV